MVLRLYVAGSSTNSSAALANLRAFCERELDDGCDLEVIDVLREPRRAEQAGIIATPTLVKEAPGGPDSIFGDLANQDEIRALIGLD